MLAGEHGCSNVFNPRSKPQTSNNKAKATATYSSPTMATSLQVGVLIIPPVQFLDAAAIDAFGMLTPEYLQACNLPEPLTKLGIPVSIHYIAASGPGTHASMTSSASLPVTDSLTSPAVQPGKLDALLIPGPDPNLIPDEEVLSFIRAHKESQKTDFLVVCTGSFPAGYAGLLDGKTVVGPRGLLGKLKEKFPKATFVERRWERDGRVWTSGTYLLHSHLLIALLIWRLYKVASRTASTSRQRICTIKSRRNSPTSSAQWRRSAIVDRTTTPAKPAIRSGGCG